DVCVPGVIGSTAAEVGLPGCGAAARTLSNWTLAKVRAAVPRKRRRFGSLSKDMALSSDRCRTCQSATTHLTGCERLDADQRLQVVGVHTPEFPFEKDLDNVRWAAKDMDVTYPIAVDSDYSIWQAFDNHCWPAVYLADVNGLLR